MALSSFLRRAYMTVTSPVRAVRMSYPIWYYLANNTARSKFNANPVSLSPVQTRIVADLRRDGIALSSLDEVFPGEGLLEILRSKAKELEPFAVAQTNKKPFILEYWEAVPELSLDNPFIALSLRNEVLSIVNSYMGMWTKFYYYMLGRTVIQDPEGARQASQRWHRDYEEVKMCKMFVYLNDVHEGAGPFMYVRGSQRGGPHRQDFPQRPGRGVYPPEGQVEKCIPDEDILTLTGKAGTVIFADTTGLHRGGFSSTGERLMYTAGYNSTAAYGAYRYRLPRQESALAPLLPEARYALRGSPAT